MPRRDQRILVGLAFVSMALVVVHSLLGLHPDLLLAVPALVLFLPLACGRYLGEDGIARLVAFCRRTVRRPIAMPGRALRAPRILPVGGRLIAAALAQRGPPGLLAAR
jgi:hypothetical protein